MLNQVVSKTLTRPVAVRADAAAPGVVLFQGARVALQTTAAPKSAWARRRTPDPPRAARRAGHCSSALRRLYTWPRCTTPFAPNTQRMVVRSALPRRCCNMAASRCVNPTRPPVSDACGRRQTDGAQSSDAARGTQGPRVCRSASLRPKRLFPTCAVFGCHWHGGTAFWRAGPTRHCRVRVRGGDSSAPMKHGYGGQQHWRASLDAAILTFVSLALS